MATNLDQYWQVDKSLILCLKYLLDNNKEFNDVTFKLTQKKENGECGEEVYVPALQTLLLARSPVFSAMFSGSMSNKKDDQLIIDLPDVEPDAFKEVIRYVYTDQVNLTTDNVTTIMYLSKKYMINNLTKACVQFLEQEMSAETAPFLLDQSMFFDDKELKEKVLLKIAQEAPAALSSDEFSKMSHKALNEVLQLNLNIEKELHVFQACMKWAEQKCVELKQSVEGEKKREVLAENLFLIRFPTMSTGDISDHVVPHGVLTAEEERKIFRYIISTSHRPQDLPFPTEQRPREHRRNASRVRCHGNRRVNRTRRVTTNPQTLRTLLIDTYYSKSGYSFSPFTPTELTSNLLCRVSWPIQITKILIAAVNASQLQYRVTLTLIQNGRILASYSGVPYQITHSWPASCIINLNNPVRVNAGSMELDLKIIAANTSGWLFEASVCFSSPNVAELSDKHVTIDFTPRKGNLLHGFEYSLSTTQLP